MTPEPLSPLSDEEIIGYRQLSKRARHGGWVGVVIEPDDLERLIAEVERSRQQSLSARARLRFYIDHCKCSLSRPCLWCLDTGKVLDELRGKSVAQPHQGGEESE